MKTTFAAAAAILAGVSVFVSASHAQPGSLDITFNPGTGPSSTVSAIGIGPSNKIVIGGDFSSVNGVSRKRVARLHSDGALDTDFVVGDGPNTTVNAVAVEPDGKVFIGGSFGTVNQISRDYLARLRADGSLDLSFPDLNLNGSVKQLLRQSDGKLIVVGSFTTVNGVTRRGVARINTDFNVDSTFYPAIGKTNGTIYTIAIQPDGNVILGGDFTALSGTNRYYIARVSTNGILDTSFDAGLIAFGCAPGVDVEALAVQPDGKILASGNFTTVNGYSRTRIVRLNQAGSVDTEFVTPGLGSSSGCYAVAYTITLQSDAKILLSGLFESVGGVTRSGIARLNSNGTLDASFNAATGSLVRSHVVQSDGRILIGGEFGNVGGTNINRIARLNGDSPPSTNLQFLVSSPYFGTYLQGTVSNTYRVEWTTDVNTQSLWTPLFNLTLQTNPQFILDPSPISGRQRFYRAVALPSP